jgi:hypothetical protein
MKTENEGMTIKKMEYINKKMRKQNYKTMTEHRLYSIACQITEPYDRFFSSGMCTLKMPRKIYAVSWKTVMSNNGETEIRALQNSAY